MAMEKKPVEATGKQAVTTNKAATPVDTKQQGEATPAQSKESGPKLVEITSAYLKKKQVFDQQSEALTKRIESSRQNIERIQGGLTKAELQLSQLVEPSVKDDLVEPLAKALAKLLPDTDGFDVIGPVGVQQAITISFIQKGATEEDRLTGKKARCITLVTKMKDGGIGVRDYSKDTKAYTPGSIGYASGLNHPVIEVPADAGIRFLLDWIK